jgi:hypothetical protein
VCGAKRRDLIALLRALVVLQFAVSLQDNTASEWRQVIDIERPFQVVDFVL